LVVELSKYIEGTKPDQINHTQDLNLTLNDLKKSDINDPEALILSLKNEILISCQSHLESIVINHIEDFSYNLRQLAKKHNVPQLDAYGNELFRYASSFDITQIKKKMEELPLFISKLIQKISS